MNLKIQTLSHFEREVKKLFKKYKKLPQDLKNLQAELLQNPKSGIDLGGCCYKIRVANTSVPTGKRGGFRVIYYYYQESDNTIYLMSIYSKSEIENIDDKMIETILQENQLL